MLGVASGIALVSLFALYTSPGARAAREREKKLSELAGPAAVGAGVPSSLAAVVEVFTVSRESAPERVELSGALEPVRAVWVAAEAEGRILEVVAVEHAPIAEGGELVRLDDQLARAALIRAEATHRLARLELERQRALGERNVASPAEIDRRLAEERGAYAALVEAREQVDKTRVRAPFAGVVNVLDLDPGAYVRPGTQIAEILDLSAVEIEVGVSDHQIGALAVGGAAQVRIPSLGGQPTAGGIVRLGQASNRETRRYPVVVRLPNPEGRLLPGMLATVELEVGLAEAIRIPRSALVREFELDYVFRLEGEGSEAIARRVRVAIRPVPFRPDRIEIREGLDPGDRIAISSAAQLRDGTRVRVLEPSGEAP